MGRTPVFLGKDKSNKIRNEIVTTLDVCMSCNIDIARLAAVGKDQINDVRYDIVVAVNIGGNTDIDVSAIGVVAEQKVDHISDDIVVAINNGTDADVNAAMTSTVAVGIHPSNALSLIGKWFAVFVSVVLPTAVFAICFGCWRIWGHLRCAHSTDNIG